MVLTHFESRKTVNVTNVSSVFDDISFGFYKSQPSCVCSRDIPQVRQTMSFCPWGELYMYTNTLQHITHFHIPMNILELLAA